MKRFSAICSAAVIATALTSCEPASSKAAAGGQVAAKAHSSGLSAKREQEVTLPAGTQMVVRLNHAVSTQANRAGERFSATLAQAVVLEGKTVIPAGVLAQGVIRESVPSGRMKGRAVIALSLDRVELGGQSYSVATNSFRRVSGNHKKRNWTLIGGGSGVGALIGGLASGGTGALIGAGAGAAAGTTGAAITGKKQVGVPAEAQITFRLTQPLSVKG